MSVRKGLSASALLAVVFVAGCGGGRQENLSPAAASSDFVAASSSPGETDSASDTSGTTSDSSGQSSGIGEKMQPATVDGEQWCRKIDAATRAKKTVRVRFNAAAGVLAGTMKFAPGGVTQFDGSLVTAGTTVPIRVMPPKVYMKAAESWVSPDPKSKNPAAQQMQSLAGLFNVFGGSSQANLMRGIKVTRGGTSTIDGTKVTKYTYRLSSEQQTRFITAQYKGKISDEMLNAILAQLKGATQTNDWYLTDSFLPLRKVERSSVKSASGELQFSQWGKPATITAPSPVRILR